MLGLTSLRISWPLTCVTYVVNTDAHITSSFTQEEEACAKKREYMLPELIFTSYYNSVSWTVVIQKNQGLKLILEREPWK